MKQRNKTIESVIKGITGKDNQTNNSKAVIGKEEIKVARDTLKKYKEGKKNLEANIIENEEWWKQQQYYYKQKDKKKKATAWLFNSITQKHADAMDNYPEPNILARAEDDKEAAELLTSVMPVIIEQNEYKKTYSNIWWYKLIKGTAVTGIFWNSDKLNGLGDVDIKKIDLLNLFWEPGVTDIQDSKNIFHLYLADTEQIKSQFNLDKISSDAENGDVAKYLYDESISTENKCIVVDWYYKKYSQGKTMLHFCKFCNDEVLFASENKKEFKNRGYYDHGKYPFVLDPLFPIEGMPTGMSYIDVARGTQEDIDDISKAITINTKLASKKRWFVREDSGFNAEDFADWEKTIIPVQGSLDEKNIKEIETTPLPSICATILNNRIEELKEITGNRDFSSGSTTSGVTAASAIAALQEAGGKQSRDMINASYDAFEQVCYIVLELVRQFYDMPRSFRIKGADGAQSYMQFDNSAIQPKEQGEAFGVDLGTKMPFFDIKIIASKKTAYAKLSQNELAIQFYSSGFFNPELTDQAISCLEMMDFESKDLVIKKISENKTMFDKLQQMTQVALQLATIVDALQGSNIAQGLLGEAGGNTAPLMQGNIATSQDLTGTQADKARAQAAEVSNPQ